MGRPRIYSDEELKARIKKRTSTPEYKAIAKAKRNTPEMKLKKKEYGQSDKAKAYEKKRNQTQKRKKSQEANRKKPENMKKIKERQQNPENIRKAKAKRDTPEWKEERKRYSQTTKVKERQKEYDSRTTSVARRKAYRESDIVMTKAEKVKQNNILNRLKVLEHYSKLLSKSEVPCCNCCGEIRIPFLAIDHILGKKQMDSIPELVAIGYSSKLRDKILIRWIIDNKFPKGFQILCHNCNFAKGMKGSNNTCPHEIERQEETFARMEEQSSFEV